MFIPRWGKCVDKKETSGLFVSGNGGKCIMNWRQKMKICWTGSKTHITFLFTIPPLQKEPACPSLGNTKYSFPAAVVQKLPFNNLQFLICNSYSNYKYLDLPGTSFVHFSTNVYLFYAPLPSLSISPQTSSFPSSHKHIANFLL